MYKNVFQQECIRIVGGEYIEFVDPNHKHIIKQHYGIKDSPKVFTLDGKSISFDLRIKDLFLYNSACITYNNKLIDREPRSNEDISLIGLEIVGRVIRYPKFYYTLMNYNLPDKTYIKDEILSELLILFDLDLEDLKLDNYIYYELCRWNLRGYRSLFNLFRLVDYRDLIVYDANEQISNCLNLNNSTSNYKL